jgi:hypothetical protein
MAALAVASPAFAGTSPTAEVASSSSDFCTEVPFGTPSQGGEVDVCYNVYNGNRHNPTAGVVIWAGAWQVDFFVDVAQDAGGGSLYHYTLTCAATTTPHPTLNQLACVPITTGPPTAK